MSKIASNINFLNFFPIDFYTKIPEFRQKIFFFEKDHYTRRILRESFLRALSIPRAIGKLSVKKPECWLNERFSFKESKNEIFCGK